MKTRILVAVIGIPILFLIIFFAPVWVLGILVGVIAGRCAWELMRATERNAPLRIRWVTTAFGFFIPVCIVFFPAARV